MDKRTETGITSNQLKLLACIFMLCDHVGLVLMNNNWIMRAVGRLAFPIFAFLLVEGYRHMKSGSRGSTGTETRHENTRCCSGQRLKVAGCNGK